MRYKSSKEYLTAIKKYIKHRQWQYMRGYFIFHLDSSFKLKF